MKERRKLSKRGMDFRRMNDDVEEEEDRCGKYEWDESNKEEVEKKIKREQKENGTEEMEICRTWR